MQHLFSHFKELTVLPQNAEELKGLILQLAIQGKLTAQWRKSNPHVSVASDLLERIKTYNQEQLNLNNRRVKIPKGEEDTVLDIPQSWVQVHNYDLFNLQKGKNPKDLSESQKKYIYQDIAALDRGSVRRYSNDEKAPKCKDTDILVVCDGSRSGLVLDGKFGIVASTLAIIHTPPFIKEYIKLVFLEDFQRANANMVGAAIPHLDTKGLLTTSIGLPPLEEQKAIVSMVNQLFAEVEQLEAATKERVRLKEDYVTSALRRLTEAETSSEWAALQPHFKTFFTETQNIKSLRESILQLAVQGKLTRKWREVNPELIQGEHSAQALLERIKAEKAKLIADKKIKKDKPLPRITEDEIPYDLPEGWEWCRLGEITTIKGGKRLPKGHKLTLEDTGRIYIRVTDMKNGSIDDSNLHYITEEVFNVISNYTIEKDDLYLTIVGATIGKLGMVPDRFHNMNLTENAARIIKYKVEKELLYYFMNSSFIQNQFFDKTNQVGVPKLALHRVSKTLFPLPPLGEQKAIVQQVNALMAFCTQLENEIQTHQTTQEHWMQSCLREAEK